jgi:hypothetical protein
MGRRVNRVRRLSRREESQLHQEVQAIWDRDWREWSLDYMFRTRERELNEVRQKLCSEWGRI